uniref:NUK12 n=1 Tax=Phytophthora infestans TaxID=4787 RepID=A1YUM2_PHYIN|nr:NUK12 [Phytophthora infestans]
MRRKVRRPVVLFWSSTSLISWMNAKERRGEIISRRKISTSCSFRPKRLRTKSTRRRKSCVRSSETPRVTTSTMK